MENVTANAKSLFHFTNKNAKFDYVYFDHVNNVGDINESSLIQFESINNDNFIILDHVYFNNCMTNGNSIYFKGYNNEIKNTIISDNISYGPTISILSPEVIKLWI